MQNKRENQKRDEPQGDEDGILDVDGWQRLLEA